jgi:hypothetical protein
MKKCFMLYGHGFIFHESVLIFFSFLKHDRCALRKGEHVSMKTLFLIHSIKITFFCLFSEDCTKKSHETKTVFCIIAHQSHKTKTVFCKIAHRYSYYMYKSWTYKYFRMKSLVKHVIIKLKFLNYDTEIFEKNC